MKLLAKTLLAIVLVLGSVILIGLGFACYARYPVARFCAEISPSATPASLRARARQAGLHVLQGHDAGHGEDTGEGNGEDTGEPHAAAASLFVLNKNAPLWRFACVVDFHDGQARGHVMAWN